jgi:hypothetical protein
MRAQRLAGRCISHPDTHGLGPLIVGLVSDSIGASLGSDSLRYSILSLVVLAYTWAGVHFLLAARTLRADLTRTEQAP